MEDYATIRKMKMQDGTELPFSLSYKRLYKLRQLKPAEFEKYNTVVMKGAKSEFDNIDILYAAYLCASIDDLKSAMPYADFLDILPINHMEVNNLAIALQMGNMGKK